MDLANYDFRGNIFDHIRFVLSECEENDCYHCKIEEDCDEFCTNMQRKRDKWRLKLSNERP